MISFIVMTSLVVITSLAIMVLVVAVISTLFVFVIVMAWDFGYLVLRWDHLWDLDTVAVEVLKSDAVMLTVIDDFKVLHEVEAETRAKYLGAYASHDSDTVDILLMFEGHKVVLRQPLNFNLRFEFHFNRWE